MGKEIVNMIGKKGWIVYDYRPIYVYVIGWHEVPEKNIAEIEVYGLSCAAFISNTDNKKLYVSKITFIHDTCRECINDVIDSHEAAIRMWEGWKRDITDIEKDRRELGEENFLKFLKENKK